MIKRLKEFALPELFDIATMYDKYVRTYKDAYDERVKYRIGISAFFDVYYLHPKADFLNDVYKKIPPLEDVGCVKLTSFTDAQLRDFLTEYDMYVICLDSYSNVGRAPVCLEEFLGSDYPNYKAELLCDRLKSQIKEYEAALLSEGAIAMRDRNKQLLDILKCFCEAFHSYDYNENALDAIAELARENKLIPAIVEWSKFKDIDLYIAVVSNALSTFFDEFCLYVMNSGA